MTTSPRDEPHRAADGVHRDDSTGIDAGRTVRTPPGPGRCEQCGTVLRAAPGEVAGHLAAVALVTAVRSGQMTSFEVARSILEDVDPVEVAAGLATQLALVMELVGASGVVNVDKWLEGTAQAAIRRAQPPTPKGE